jgi:uncharacterized protein (TIGR01440 family)
MAEQSATGGPAETKLELERIAADVATIARELVQAGGLKPGNLVVVGVSTSEVIGRRIGTSGTEEAAARIFQGLKRVQEEAGIELAFQCCEHLNRALVVETEYMERAGLEAVTVIPVPKAGGSMAAYAYRHMRNPCVVESVRAHAGIDIGDTLIGMHLRNVAVPFRPSVRSVGAAHVNAAYTRPKLIGGARAVYTMEAADADRSGSCR